MVRKAMAAVLVYNTPELVGRVRRRYPDMVIVDNGSDPPIRGAHVRIAENLLFSGGWNYAAHALSGACEYLWMLNSDVSGARPETADRMLARVAGPCDVVSPTFAGCPHPHMRGRGREVVRVRWVDWVAPLVRLAWFLEGGGFDEGLPGYGADIDLCYRRGGYLYVDPRERLRHLWGATVRKTGDRRIHQTREARQYLVEKHGDDVTRFAVSFFGGRR